MIQDLDSRAALRVSRPPSHREFMLSAEYCGVPDVSEAMLVVVDAAEARPVLNTALCLQLFGCAPERLPRQRPSIVGVSAGGRSGKSTRLLATKALHAAWTVPLPTLAPGEEAVSLLVAPKRRLAQQAFNVVKGMAERSPRLKDAIVHKGTSFLVLRRPDGQLCRVEVGTANRGGQDARGYTLVFCGMDEACFFYADDGYTVTDQDLFDAAIQRLVPGAQLWIVSTPWIEEVGLLEGYIKTDWGKHENALVAARVSTRLLNPNWDKTGAIEKKMRAQPGGDLNVEREIYAKPFEKGTNQFFPPSAIKLCMELDVPQEQPEATAAGMDIGHINDASSLAVSSRYFAGKFAVRDLLTFESTEVQQPSHTYRAFALKLQEHGLRDCAGDSQYKATVREVFQKFGLAFVDANGSKDQVYMAMREVMTEGRLSLKALPQSQRERVAEQLRSVVSKPMQGGKIKIIAARQKLSEGETQVHADDISAIVVSLWRVGSGDTSLWQPKPQVHRQQPPPQARRSPRDDYRLGSRDDFR